MKYIVAPINRAILLVHADDKKFDLLIATWDDLGVKGCLDAERTLVVEEFARLVENLSALKIPHSLLDDNLISTAFVQEFERRLGQKRKSRGGTSLETVTDFIFNYYGFKSTTEPNHFDQDIEVDKWFKCKFDR